MIGSALFAVLLAGSPEGISTTLAQMDDLHRRRDDQLAQMEARRVSDRAVATWPTEFEVLWRAARVQFWQSDDPGLPVDQRSAAGQRGWELAERARSLRPEHPAGHYWAAVNMAGYAMGLGLFRALAQNLDGQFRERLGRAMQLDPSYEAGSVLVAWGRFLDKLPWPKRDAKKAEEHLRQALQLNPRSLRARVYLAELLLREDRPAEAKRLVDEVAAAPPGDDPAEERRSKALASGLLPSILKKLK